MTINGSPVSVTGITRDGDYLNVSVNSQSITGSERIVVTGHDVVNPSSAGTHTATVELDGGSGAFDTYDGSLDIVPGGYANGTVTDASGSPLAGASVTVRNATTKVTVASNTTDASGNYSTHVPADGYELVVTASGHEKVTRTVTVSTGAENTTDVQLAKLGYVNGTVTDGQGAVSGVPVILVDASGGTFTDVDSAMTGPSGTYSLAGPPGTYDVVVPSDDHEFEVRSDVNVTGGATTLDVGLTALPGDGTITGTVEDANGNPITSGRVAVRDDTYSHFNSTRLNGSSTFSLRAPAGTYQLRANTTGLPSRRVGDIEVTEGGTTDVTVTLREPAYIEGTVTNASGPVPRTFVVADNGERSEVAITDTNGDYNVTVPPGEYTVSVFASGQDAPSTSVTAESDTTTRANFTLQRTEILASNVTKVGGPGDASKIGVRSQVRAGFLQIQLVNESARSGSGVGKPSELETLGVDETTEFEITVTVTNFTANSLLWGLRDAEMETQDNATAANATDITLRGSPVQLQATFSSGQRVGPLLRQDPSDVTWPTGRNDRADDGFNDTVYVGVFDLSSVPASVRTTLNGMSVTTNAQRFSTPKVENDTLRVWVAGPSKTVGGADHDGFYQATIPDAQLDAWGVDDPVTDLRAMYKGQQRDFSVTETAGGARIVIDDIDYSAGFVEVEPDPSAGGGDANDGGGGGSATGTTHLVDGGATVSFGHGSDVRSVEIISPGTSGTVTVRPLGPLPDDTPDPGGIVLTSVDIAAPEPTDGATVRITLSDALLDRHVVEPDELAIQHYDAGSGEWERLDTSVTGVDGGVLLEAETDAFSVFAVGRPAERTTAGPTPTTATATGTPAPSTPGTAAAERTPTRTATRTATPNAGPAATATGTPSADRPETGTPTTGAGPGVGPVVAVVALLVAALLAGRRD